MLVTVFTPTYNRAHLLPALYESIRNQANHNFEWLIIDDGSTDDTEELVQSFLSNNNPFEIRYIKKDNEGLNQTINRGLDEARGEAFFRVDSDDSILPCAVDEIQLNWHRIAYDPTLCALVFLSVYDEDRSKVVGCNPFAEDTVTNFFDYRYKYNAVGDRPEVVKTEIYRQFKFEKFGDEKFCPEALMWNRMSKNYDALYVVAPIYIRLYQETSISTNMVAFLKNGVKGTTTYYAELCRLNPPFNHYVKAAGSYFRYAFFSKFGVKKIFGDVSFKAVVLGLPFGLALIVADSIAPSWYKWIMKR